MDESRSEPERNGGAPGAGEAGATTLQAGQALVLEMIATGAPLDDVLREVVELVEEHAAGLIGSVLLARDGRLRHGAAPSLPEEYSRAIDGIEIGPAAGSCGTAAYRRAPVVVADIASDPLWREYRELALAHGLRASWSTPILGSQGQLLGTFALYQRAPSEPTAWHRELVSVATHLVGIALQRARNEEERERLLRELEAHRSRMAAVVEHAPVGIVIAEAPSGRVVMGNRMAELIFRHPVMRSDGVHAYGDWVAFHPDGRRVEGSEYPVARAIATGRIAGPDRYLYQRGDGTQAWVEITGAPIRDAGGELVAALALIDDVDAAVRAEAERERLLRELELERSRLTSVFMEAPALICTLRGPEHVFEMANPHFLQMVGFRELVGRPIREALPEIAEQGFVELLDRVRETGESYVGREVRVHLRHPAGAEPAARYINFVYEPLVEADGRVSGIFVHGVDVTDQVRSRQVAEEANRAKSDFLATMSHELRTPLNAMLGYTELLEMGIPERLPAGVLSYVERIRLSASHLLQLIEEILTFSRIEAGRERVERAPVELGELAREVGAILEPLADRQRLQLTIEVPAEPVRLRTDPRKLRQILLNLLGNAIKFTEEGEVHFVARPEGDRVRFEVADTGIGIAPDHLERVFEPFWQAETAMHARVGGTGLGLPVTRRLVELLGGEIRVYSEQGRGSTFVVVLPLDAPAAT